LNLLDCPRRVARGIVQHLPRDMPRVHMSPRDQMSKPRQTLEGMKNFSIKILVAEVNRISFGCDDRDRIEQVTYRLPRSHQEYYTRNMEKIYERRAWSE
jgi:hypothetical protein